MKHKDEALDKLKLFLAKIKLDGFSMRELRTDNRGEYVNDAFKAYAIGKFTLRTTLLHTPIADGNPVVATVVTLRYLRAVQQGTR